ncbi:conserved hypothetical protein [Candidatus Desulfarcum epimagneticum]|uniref:N-acetyltransferase domain-containing protein n=1 Tax=uncultured Desulfobacteraceae bacterium TaxID=218296 RepID=A0A484HIH3_9BACT|nr:conserved hypothetical protein [uncultured Desulfobacteraceae bacterium]
MIRGWRVNLRPVSVHDLPHMVKWRRDMRLMGYYDRPVPISPDEMEIEIRDHIKSPDRLDFIVESKKGEPLGPAFFEHIDRESRHGEINIMIAEKKRGAAFHGANSAFLLLLYAFRKMNLRKVYGRIIEYASESRALLEAVGFKKEAVWREYFYQKGRRWDFHVYGLLRDDFERFLKTPRGRRYLKASGEK